MLITLPSNVMKLHSMMFPPSGITSKIGQMESENFEVLLYIIFSIYTLGSNALLILLQLHDFMCFHTVFSINK